MYTVTNYGHTNARSTFRHLLTALPGPAVQHLPERVLDQQVAAARAVPQAQVPQPPALPRRAPRVSGLRGHRPTALVAEVDRGDRGRRDWAVSCLGWCEMMFSDAEQAEQLFWISDRDKSLFGLTEF